MPPQFYEYGNQNSAPNFSWFNTMQPITQLILAATSQANQNASSSSQTTHPPQPQVTAPVTSASNNNNNANNGDASDTNNDNLFRQVLTNLTTWMQNTQNPRK